MPVVPFIPAIVGGVGAIAGGAMQAGAARDAAGSQSAAAMAGIQNEREMFERSLELQEPYREAGYGALSGLQGLLDPKQRSQALNSFYRSPEYMDMSRQAEKATLRNEAAQGGLRSGSSYANLQNIAPQLGQNFLSDRYNQLTGLANMGMGASSAGAQNAMQSGMNQSNLLGQLGSAQAGQSIAQGNSWASTLQGLGGALGQGWGVAQEQGYI